MNEQTSASTRMNIQLSEWVNQCVRIYNYYYSISTQINKQTSALTRMNIQISRWVH